MPITDQEKWDEYVRVNSEDPYSKCCVDIARRVMELLDMEEHAGPLHHGYHPDLQTPHGLICKADHDIEAGGITGFMAGAATQMVVQCHSRGEEFRLAHNVGYGHEGEGVVNPAIINIEVPEGKTAEEVITEAAEKAGMEVMDKDEVLDYFGIDKEES
jgi:hypothetical protein